MRVLAAYTITELIRRRADAFFALFDIWRLAIERARIPGGTSGRRVIRIVALLPVLGGIDQ